MTRLHAARPSTVREATLRAMVRDWVQHIVHCRKVRGLLREHDTEHLRNLYWYDMRLRDAVGPRGIARVIAWNLFRRRFDEIAGNYGLRNLYHAPPNGDGLRQSGATVWRCASLASQPWFDGDDPVREVLEQNAAAIIGEYRAVAPPLTTHPDNASLTQQGRWTGLFLYKAQGVRNQELCSRCPTTAKAVEALPLCTNFGFVMFSGMQPRTHIAPHCGSSNLRLRYHLGIEVPEPGKSWLRVGTEKRSWEAGKVLAFDDSFEHEVDHAGALPRVVLVIDVWHPSLTAADIAVLGQPVFRRFGRVGG